MNRVMGDYVYEIRRNLEEKGLIGRLKFSFIKVFVTMWFAVSLFIYLFKYDTKSVTGYNTKFYEYLLLSVVGFIIITYTIILITFGVYLIIKLATNIKVIIATLKLSKYPMKFEDLQKNNIDNADDFVINLNRIRRIGVSTYLELSAEDLKIAEETLNKLVATEEVEQELKEYRVSLYVKALKNTNELTKITNKDELHRKIIGKSIIKKENNIGRIKRNY